MDPVRNPYAPGAGSPPPELAGRSGVLGDVEVALSRIRNGRSNQGPILVGLRGVGKTVLLVRIKELAETMYKTAMVEADENKTLPSLLVPNLSENAKDKARRGLRVLKGFLGGL